MPYFHLRKFDLYYRAAGRGRTALILVHGWYQNGKQAFSPMLPYLREKYHVFIPDLPGHGFSPHMPADFSTRFNEDLLAEFIRYIRQRYRCRRVFVAGHSYGAFTVLALAARIPRELSGIIAISAVDDYTPYHKRLKRVLYLPRWFMALYYRLQALRGAFPYGDREQLYGQAHHRLKPGKLAYAKKKNKILAPTASRRYVRAFLSARIEWPAEKISLPLLLVYGERDLLTPASWAEKIQTHFERSSVAVITDAGHNVQITAPQAVADAMRRFVRDSA